jgi:hypothetical protein
MKKEPWAEYDISRAEELIEGMSDAIKAGENLEFC